MPVWCAEKRSGLSSWRMRENRRMRSFADINAYIDGLQNGSSELDLVRLDDRDFQDKMTELASYFEELKAEILLVREKGYENTAIIEKSETFFKICDEATGLAEAYSQRMASSLKKLEQVVVGDIIGLVFVIGMELIKAVRYAAMNRTLQKKVYLDEATGLPNKNKCEEILEGSDGGEEISGVYAVCVFDLNNLRTINNSLGHDKGDEYIRSFAVQLRKAVPEEYFVGRNGGDEFLAILRGLEPRRSGSVHESHPHADGRIFPPAPGDADQLRRRLCTVHGI